MRSYKEWEEEEIEENEPTRWPINNYVYTIDNKRSNYSSKVNYASKYNTTSSSKNFGTSRKEPKKDYNYNYSYSSQNDEQRNSAKYYSHNNKYLTLFNVSTRSYEPSTATVSKDGVLRGYTDNCSFYISGSSDLKPKPTILNKYKSKNEKKNDKYNNYNSNYSKYSSQNRSGRQNKVYESRTQVINPSDYIKKDVKKDTTRYKPRNENQYKKNNYNSKTNINTRVYTINNISNNNNYERKNYHSVISPKKNIPKSSNLSSNYSRKSYYETEPNNYLKHYYNNNKSDYRDNIRKPIVPSKNIINKEPRATIQTVNNINNNARRIYKTSTNTKLEEKNKNNYYTNIVEKKSYQDKKRNNTPNLSSRENRNDNTSVHYITSERLTEPGKSSIPNRNNYKSVIPHNKGYRYKNNTDINENILNKTDRNYQPKYTLQRKNSNSNINKNRYNFPERPKLREYGTKTEVHSYSTNKYSKNIFNSHEREKSYGIPYNKNKEINENKNYKKLEPKNRYQTRSYSINAASRGGKKYGVKTESIAMNRNRNYSRSNEYEVTDIASYKKKQQQKESYSLIKNIPKAVKPTIQPNKTLNNKKEYTTFERSYRNIKDNKKEIEKEKNNANNKGNIENNHTIFISDFSKNKKLYKTSTQKQAFRPHGYTLSSSNEYEVPAPVKKYQNYQKIDVNKSKYDNKNKYDDNKNKANNRYKNININKNNYFNAMKNLEEEIEVDDDNEQVEYLPPRTLTKIETKPKESKFSYNINKSFQSKPENKYNYSIKNTQNENKTKYNKDIKNNQEKYKTEETKKNNPPQYTNDIKPTKNYYTSINTSKNQKEKENKNPNTNINKSQEYKQKQQYIPQHIQQKPILVPQKKDQKIQTKPQNQIVPQKQYQQNIQIQPQNRPQKEQQMKISEKKEIQIQQPQQQKLEEVHQIEDYIEEEDHNIQDNENEEENENIEDNQKYENNNLKKSKYSSYFGDFNNNYYEIKGVSASGEKNEDEEENEGEEENENNEKEKENENESPQKIYNQPMEPVRNITFDIQSENLMVPAQPEDDKEEKEADEQLIEEDEQNDINDENEEENEQMDMEQIAEENDGEEQNYQENDNEEEGEMVGDEIDINEEENGNEEYDENEVNEGEEIEDNMIEENNLNEEEEINENENE